MTPEEWLDDAPFEVEYEWDELQRMQAYADYYAREQAIQFHLWVESLTPEQAIYGDCSIHDYYTKFLNEQKEKQ